MIYLLIRDLTSDRKQADNILFFLSVLIKTARLSVIFLGSMLI